MKSIELIMPYFGAWPPWIDYFLLSCSYNPTIRWQIFTDCAIPAYRSDNVIFTHMTLADFNGLASKKLQIPINITRPYKLCDFKPAYRIIFEEFLPPHDFWGYGDLDLIYGNIRGFLSDEILESHEVVTTGEKFMAGHFTLFRNMEMTNRLFERCPRYKQIFQQNEIHYAFDEIYKPQGIEKLFQRAQNAFKKMNPLKKPFNIDGPNYFIDRYRLFPYDMTHLVMKSVRAKEIRLYNEMIHLSKSWYQRRKIKDWTLLWNRGTLTELVQNKEILYIHFLASLRKKEFQTPTFHHDIEKFYVTKYGITLC